MTTVDSTAQAAADAFGSWQGFAATARADILDAAAYALDARSAELVDIADRETALGELRLSGELKRTSNQLRMFGDVLREGSYVEATVDTPDPSTVPPRPDLRRMLRPLGPVGVFAASNFPFAFSVAGGDTASALAAGCPVVVKAHEGHPETSVRTHAVVAEALVRAGAPDGVLGLVSGFEAGAALVGHPDVTAIGFTGSQRGGRALAELAAARPDPIPFYGELGSVNPVVVLPGAAAERLSEIAGGFAGSLTLGVGQFCTNPGLLFAPADAVPAVAEAVRGSSGGVMLTERIADGYATGVNALDGDEDVELVATGAATDGARTAAPRLYRVGLAAFAARVAELSEECFGPAGILVTYEHVDELVPVLRRLPGSLTGSVHAAESETGARQIADALRDVVGRLIWNGWPTGVAVAWGMHHGGPWPATNNPLHTSVGATAIRRWLAPISYQSWPDELLPPELRNANPLGIPRRHNGVLEV